MPQLLIIIKDTTTVIVHETTTIDQQTVTADTFTSTVYNYTATVTWTESATASATGAGQCNANNQKREAAPVVAVTRTLPDNCPGPLRGFRSAFISSACRCLDLPTPTFLPVTTLVSWQGA